MKNKENDTPMSVSVWSSFQSSINYLVTNFYYIMSKYCLQTNDDEHTDHLALPISCIWWWTHHVSQKKKKKILIKQ